MKQECHTDKIFHHWLPQKLWWKFHQNDNSVSVNYVSVCPGIIKIRCLIQYEDCLFRYMNSIMVTWSWDSLIFIGNPYAGKVASLYWIRPQGIISHVIYLVCLSILRCHIHSWSARNLLSHMIQISGFSDLCCSKNFKGHCSPVTCCLLGPPLLTWINFNPSMNK